RHFLRFGGRTFDVVAPPLSGRIYQHGAGGCSSREGMSLIVRPDRLTENLGRVDLCRGDIAVEVPDLCEQRGQDLEAACRCLGLAEVVDVNGRVAEVGYHDAPERHPSGAGTGRAAARAGTAAGARRRAARTRKATARTGEAAAART